MLSEIVPSADFEIGSLTFVTQILRRSADAGKGVDSVLGTKRSRSQNNRVGMNNALGTEGNIRTDNRERTDNATFSDFR
jgi:hypothetical protein